MNGPMQPPQMGKPPGPMSSPWSGQTFGAFPMAPPTPPAAPVSQPYPSFPNSGGFGSGQGFEAKQPSPNGFTPPQPEANVAPIGTLPDASQNPWTMLQNLMGQNG